MCPLFLLQVHMAVRILPPLRYAIYNSTLWHLRLPPSACSVFLNPLNILITCDTLLALAHALASCRLSLLSLPLGRRRALILRLAPCGGAPMGAPGSLSQPPPIISLYLYKRSVIPFLFTILFTATRSLLPFLLSLLLLLVLSSRSSGRLSSRAGR